MTRLMCSSDRQELETLRSRLSKAGIPSEIRSNPVVAMLGGTRLEIFVHEIDLLRASKVWQGLETAVKADDAAGSPGGGRTINGIVKSEESELVIEADVLPSPATESPREEHPRRGPETGGAEPEGDFAQARDAQLERIAESLTKARAEMEQEKDLRRAVKQKSGELAGALKSLECQLAQQARRREQLLNERRDVQEQMRVCVGEINALCNRVGAVLAAREKQ
jgi:hypothetical protein